MAKGKSPSIGWLLLAILVVFVIWGASGLALYHDKERGTFGDMFGAVNALFTGLAFAALIYTVSLQRHDLALQQQELKDTREELKGQKEALEAQYALQRRTAEAALMQRLMAEYDGLRDDMATLVSFHKGNGGDKMFETIHEAFQKRKDESFHKVRRTARKMDPQRFKVSRFFVKIRRLATAGYISDGLVAISLERLGVVTFLRIVDPFDKVMAGKDYSSADKDYYEMLLKNHYSTAAVNEPEAPSESPSWESEVETI